jgi:hypothetical protein
MEKNNSSNLEKEFPAVKLAYPLAMESYKTARERFDAMEKRGQSFIAFVTTVALAIVAIVAKDKKLSFVSIWCILATLTYITAIIFAIMSQTSGKLILPNPKLLREKTLGWSEWEFQNNLIDWAGKHYEHNLEQINKRWKMVNGVITFGFATLLLLAVWVSQ